MSLLFGRGYWRQTDANRVLRKCPRRSGTKGNLESGRYLANFEAVWVLSEFRGGLGT